MTTSTVLPVRVSARRHTRIQQLVIIKSVIKSLFCFLTLQLGRLVKTNKIMANNMLLTLKKKDALPAEMSVEG